MMRMILEVMVVMKGVVTEVVTEVVTRPEKVLRAKKKWIFLEKREKVQNQRMQEIILKREKVQNQRMKEIILKRKKIQNQRTAERILKKIQREKEKIAIRAMILKSAMGTLKTRILLMIPVKKKITKVNPVT
jgi:RecA-family ATPase